MKLKLILVLSVCMVSVFLISCGKECECREWSNGFTNNPYSVSLEMDGSSCTDYSTIIETDSLWTGIQCYEKK